jgi:hypothetical protein
MKWGIFMQFIAPASRITVTGDNGLSQRGYEQADSGYSMSAWPQGEPAKEKQNEKCSISPGPGYPERGHAAVELVPEDEARVGCFEGDTVEDGVAAANRIDCGSEKDDSEYKQQQRRELDVTVVVRRGDPEIAKHGSGGDGEDEADDAIEGATQDENQSYPAVSHGLSSMIS